MMPRSSRPRSLFLGVVVAARRLSLPARSSVSARRLSTCHRVVQHLLCVPMGAHHKPSKPSKKNMPSEKSKQSSRMTGFNSLQAWRSESRKLAPPNMSACDFQHFMYSEHYKVINLDSDADRSQYKTPAHTYFCPRGGYATEYRPIHYFVCTGRIMTQKMQAVFQDYARAQAKLKPHGLSNLRVYPLLGEPPSVSPEYAAIVASSW